MHSSTSAAITSRPNEKEPSTPARYGARHEEKRVSLFVFSYFYSMSCVAAPPRVELFEIIRMHE